MISRTDWSQWKSYQESVTGGVRRASYSDYTIQHPIYKELKFPPNYSASLRYTIENQWIVMRGQGVRTKGSSGHAQYPALASLLCERPEFCGGGFSYGDRYIYSQGQNILNPNPGNAKTWIEAGLNHHMTYVVAQVHSFKTQLATTISKLN